MNDSQDHKDLNDFDKLERQLAKIPIVQPSGFEVKGTPEQVAALFEAFSQAQGEYESVSRSGSAGKEVFGRPYDYAQLGDILAATRPALSKHGLWFNQPPVKVDADTFTLYSVIGHKGGGMMSTVMSVSMEAVTQGSRMSPLQAFGSALTYLQKYSARCMLGVAAQEEDDDGNGAAGHEGATSTKPQKRREPEAAPKRQEAPRPKVPTSEFMDPPAGLVRDPGPVTKPVNEVPAEDALSDATALELQTLCVSLGLRGVPKSEKVKEVTGKNIQQLTEADGLKLVEVLKAEFAAKGGA